MKPLVIYHADCTDGFAAAFAAWLKLGDEAEYLPMNYNQDGPSELRWSHALKDREIYILDFSFPRDQMEFFFQHAKCVVWLDHHKTALKMWCDGIPPGGKYADTMNDSRYIVLHNNKSGALLAWEYFHPDTEVPLLIQHIDDRDRWQWKMDGSAELHVALGAMKPWSFGQWKSIIGCQPPNANVEYLINEGRAILRAQKQHVVSMAKNARKCVIQGRDREPLDNWFYSGLAVNATLHMSEVGHELANQSGTFGLVWCVSTDNRAKCSLRSNGDYDVSAIAKAFGGGGHKNAAGFETKIDTLMGWLK